MHTPERRYQSEIILHASAYSKRDDSRLRQQHRVRGLGDTVNKASNLKMRRIAVPQIIGGYMLCWKTGELHVPRRHREDGNKNDRRWIRTSLDKHNHTH